MKTASQFPTTPMGETSKAPNFEATNALSLNVLEEQKQPLEWLIDE